MRRHHLITLNEEHSKSELEKFHQFMIANIERMKNGVLHKQLAKEYGVDIDTYYSLMRSIGDKDIEVELAIPRLATIGKSLDIPAHISNLLIGFAKKRMLTKWVSDPTDTDDQIFNGLRNHTRLIGLVLPSAKIPNDMVAIPVDEYNAVVGLKSNSELVSTQAKILINTGLDSDESTFVNGLAFGYPPAPVLAFLLSSHNKKAALALPKEERYGRVSWDGKPKISI